VLKSKLPKVLSGGGERFELGLMEVLKEKKEKNI
jgi:hypothetical protein